MDNISVDVLQAVITHSSNQEPRANIRVLLNSKRCLALTTSIDIQSREMAWELASIFSNKAPFREFFLFRAFYVESSNLVSAKLKPEHVVC